MKRVITAAFCVVAFILIAAPIYVENPTTYPLFINGKKLADAYNINGIIAISVADLAKAAGGTLTLEQAGLRLQGNMLSAALVGQNSMKIKMEPSAAPDTVTSPTERHLSTGQHFPKATLLVRKVKVQESGEISTHVFTDGGKAFVPVVDIAKAFGARTFTINAANLKPGQAINVAVGDVNGVLAMTH